MKILLAADGSEYTRRAARYLATFAASLAKRPEVHLLHVHAPIPYPRAASVAGSDAVHRYHEEDAAKALAVAEEVLATAGIACESCWVAGEPGKEIAAYVAKNAIDLIVMGSHGHGTLRTLVLGSVADRVLREATCPVMIVK